MMFNNECLEQILIYEKIMERKFIVGKFVLNRVNTFHVSQSFVLI